MSTRSLRLRLLGLAIVSTVGALSATYVALTIIYARHIDRRILGELQQRSLELVGALSVDAAGNPALDRSLSDPRYDLPYGGAYWQVSADGKAVLRSRSLWDRTLRLDTQASGQPRLVRQPGPDDDALDVLTRSVSIPSLKAGPLIVSVAFGRKDVEAQTQSFSIDAAAALSLLGVMLVGGLWLQVRIGLRPLDAVRSHLAAVHRGRAQTIEGPFPDEVEPLVRDLNALFAAQRAQVMLAREQAGDLAHALKTPLTIIEGEALRLAQAGEAGTAGVLSDQVVAMRRNVDRVLARARVRGLASAPVAATSLRATVERLFAVMVRLPRGDVLDWRDAVDGSILVDMDLDDLGEVLGNLLDNARKSARKHIEVSAIAERDRVRIHVRDDGPGIAPGQRATLRQRGRSGSDAGSGLGLAIVGDLLGAYASKLEFATDRDGWFCASFSVGGLLAAPGRRAGER